MQKMRLSFLLLLSVCLLIYPAAKAPEKKQDTDQQNVYYKVAIIALKVMQKEADAGDGEKALSHWMAHYDLLSRVIMQVIKSLSLQALLY
jgi:hypothetical protein